MKIFSDRLRELRDKLGLSQSQMAPLLGVSSGNYVSQLEKGKKETSPMLIRLVEHLEEDANAENHDLLKDETRQYFVKPVRWVPLIPWETRITLEDLTDLMTKKSFGEVPVETTDTSAFAIKLRGDAMSPDYQEGGILIVSPATPLENECLCLAKPPDGAPIFRRYLVAAAGRFLLVPYNKVYPTTEHSSSDFDWIYPVISMVVDLFPK